MCLSLLDIRAIVYFSIRGSLLPLAAEPRTRDLLLPRLVSGEVDASELEIDVGGRGPGQDAELAAGLGVPAWGERAHAPRHHRRRAQRAIGPSRPCAKLSSEV